MNICEIVTHMYMYKHNIYEAWITKKKFDENHLEICGW